MGIVVEDTISEQHYLVYADHMRLKQVILNLMSNAIKYNSPSGKLILNARVIKNEHIQIGITDTGKGLSECDVAKLFKPFERLNVKENIKGTGIGLVITKNLVELMGGEIL